MDGGPAAGNRRENVQPRLQQITLYVYVLFWALRARSRVTRRRGAGAGHELGLRSISKADVWCNWGYRKVEHRRRCSVSKAAFAFAADGHESRTREAGYGKKTEKATSTQTHAHSGTNNEGWCHKMMRTCTTKASHNDEWRESSSDSEVQRDPDSHILGIQHEQQKPSCTLNQEPANSSTDALVPERWRQGAEWDRSFVTAN